MNSYYKYLNCLNEDMYNYSMFASSKGELAEKMLNCFEANGYELDIDIDEEPSIIVEDMIEWTGAGEYCLRTLSGDCDMIINTKDTFECILQDSYFPVDLSIELFDNTLDYIKKWKVKENIKFMYLIGQTYNNKITYVVKSNNKINNPIELLHEEEDIFIGEFNTLGTNYYCIEVEKIDSNFILETLINMACDNYPDEFEFNKEKSKYRKTAN